MADQYESKNPDREPFEPNQRWSPGPIESKTKEGSLQRIQGPMELGRDTGEPLKSERLGKQNDSETDEPGLHREEMGDEEFDPLE